MAEINDGTRDFLGLASWQRSAGISTMPLSRRTSRTSWQKSSGSREAAGESGETRLLVAMEMLSVASLRGGLADRRDSEVPLSRIAYLWVTTNAGVVEVASQTDGEESKHDLIEYPERHIA